MTLSAYGKSDIGLLRGNNEDSLHVDVSRGLFVIADGMGGHAAGEIASAMAISRVRETLEPQLGRKQQTGEWQALLAEAIHQADQTVSQAALDNPAWSGMGTTLTILLIADGQAILGHVGDSRLYRWRRQQLERISEDHTLVADQLRRGILTNQEADKSNLRNVLLQAVGLGEELDICLKSFPVEAGDRFLLCSDGLTDMLSEHTISTLLGGNNRPREGCEQLIAEALKAGGKDNISVILLDI